MHNMNRLMGVEGMQNSVTELQREMIHSGLISEKVEDAFDDLQPVSEGEVDKEVNAVYLKIAAEAQTTAAGPAALAPSHVAVANQQPMQPMLIGADGLIVARGGPGGGGAGNPQGGGGMQLQGGVPGWGAGPMGGQMGFPGGFSSGGVGTMGMPMGWAPGMGMPMGWGPGVGTPMGWGPQGPNTGGPSTPGGGGGTQ